MEPVIRAHLEDVRSGDKDRQNTAFSQLMAATETPVSWAYEAWDELVSLLAHPNNRTRAIAAQVLCNLAKSDPDVRMVEDLDALLAVTKDERFVTARHCLQSLWKVGSAGPRQRERLLNGLETRFHECSEEKNCTLIRFDIIQSLERVYGQTADETVRDRALTLIDAEPDAKYRKKYARVWRAR
jgi:hypothetical protein